MERNSILKYTILLVTHQSYTLFLSSKGIREDSFLYTDQNTIISLFTFEKI